MRRVQWFAGVALATGLACDDSAVPAAVKGPADAASDGALASDAASPSRRDAATPLYPDVARPAEPCNGEAEYCDKPYDALTSVATHAAAATTASVFSCATQRESVRTQLDQGIRALDLQVFETESARPMPGRDDAGRVRDAGAASDARGAGDAPRAQGPLLSCLGDCRRGSLPLRGSLAAVKAFLDVNPREVVTLLVEGGVDGERLAEELTRAELEGLAWPQATGAEWPTLRAMIESGKRLVVLADVAGSPPRFILPLWKFVGATSTNARTLGELTCDVVAGEPAPPLYWINNYLVDGEAGRVCGSEALAHAANEEPSIRRRIQACVEKRKKPAFIAVDYYEDGDVRELVRGLNLGP